MPELTSPFAGKPISRADANRLAYTVKALADPARLQLLSLLASGGERTNLELIQALGWLSQPTVSHHLRILADAGFIVRRAEGNFVYNRLAPAAVAAVAYALRPGRR
ncbi:MAG: transcriptional regulator, arsr family protein [Nocardioides sp.]|nr:transcriptional regulator, arsr family protein [Nocardioides sp.]